LLVTKETPGALPVALADTVPVILTSEEMNEEELTTPPSIFIPLEAPLLAPVVLPTRVISLAPEIVPSIKIPWEAVAPVAGVEALKARGCIPALCIKANPLRAIP
jgi:hypothetical protein